MARLERTGRERGGERPLDREHERDWPGSSWMGEMVRWERWDRGHGGAAGASRGLMGPDGTCRRKTGGRLAEDQGTDKTGRRGTAGANGQARNTTAARHAHRLAGDRLSTTFSAGLTIKVWAWIVLDKAARASP